MADFQFEISDRSVPRGIVSASALLSPLSKIASLIFESRLCRDRPERGASANTGRGLCIAKEKSSNHILVKKSTSFCLYIPNLIRGGGAFPK